MNCENSNTTVHFVCPAWSTLMFLVLVCLFVKMSPYKTALKPVFTPHLVVFQMHTPVNTVWKCHWLSGHFRELIMLSQHRIADVDKSCKSVIESEFTTSFLQFWNWKKGLLIYKNSGIQLIVHRFIWQSCCNGVLYRMLGLWCVTCKSVVRGVT